MLAGAPAAWSAWCCGSVGRRGLARRQVVVLLVGGAVLVVDCAAACAARPGRRAVSQAAAVALVPVAIGVAVTRHRLYDLDLAVWRALAGGQPGGLPGRGLPAAFGVLAGPPGDRTAIAARAAAG